MGHRAVAGNQCCGTEFSGFSVGSYGEPKVLYFTCNYLRISSAAWSPRVVPSGGNSTAVGCPYNGEIDGERYALKLIRGDFKDVQQSLESGGAQAEAILRAMGPHAGVQGKAMKGKNVKTSAGHK